MASLGIVANRVRWSTVVAFVAAAIVILTWGFTSPVGSDPDGTFHANSIWCGQGLRNGYCEAPPREQSATTPKTIMTPAGVNALGSCFRFVPQQSASCETGYLSSLDMTPNQFNNEGRLYPNLYYWTASHFVSDNINRSLILVRIFDIFALLMLAAIVFVSATPNIQRGVFGSIVITWVPLGLFTASSNNGSAWTLIGVSFFWALLWTGLRGRAGWRTVLAWIGVLVSGIMAIGSRFDGAIYVMFSAIAVLVVSWHFCAGKVHRLLGLGSVLFTAIGTLWVFLTTEQGQIVSVGLMGEQKFEVGAADVLWTNIFRIPGLFLGIFGIDGFGSGLGWLDTPMPPITWSFMLIGLVVVVSTWSPPRTTVHKFSLSALVVAVVAIPMYVLQVDRAVVIQNVQSRYLLPLVTVIVGLALVSSSDQLSQRHMTRRTTGVVVSLIAVAHGAALHTNMRRYISGLDVVSPNLSEAKEWWPTWLPNPNVCWILATVSMAIVVCAVLSISQRDVAVATTSDELTDVTNAV